MCVCALQRVLEADENGDGFHDDEDFELDTPKRKNRNRGKVSVRHKDSVDSHIYCVCEGIITQYKIHQMKKVYSMLLP